MRQQQKQQHDDNHDIGIIASHNDDNNNQNIIVVPPKTYAVMVHKLYVHRVQDYMYRNTNRSINNNNNKYTTTITTTTMYDNVDNENDVVTNNYATGHTNTDSNSQQKQEQDTSLYSPQSLEPSNTIRILDIPDVSTGVSRNRRGYVLLLLTETTNSWINLSPMARQNISWIGTITHSMVIVPSKSPSIIRNDNKSDGNNNNSNDCCNGTVTKISNAENSINKDDEHHTRIKSTSKVSSIVPPRYEHDNDDVITDQVLQIIYNHLINSTKFQLQQQQQNVSTTDDSNNNGNRNHSYGSSSEHPQNYSKLRVDCYPRHLTEHVCYKLQYYAAQSVLAQQQQQQTTDCAINFSSHSTQTADNNNNTEQNRYPTDPYEGYISMTMSRSKCTHRLILIYVPSISSTEQSQSITITTTTTSGDEAETNNTSTSLSNEVCCYWGIERQQQQQDDDDNNNNNDSRTTTTNINLNHDAAKEIIVVPDAQLSSKNQPAKPSNQKAKKKSKKRKIQISSNSNSEETLGGMLYGDNDDTTSNEPMRQTTNNNNDTVNTIQYEQDTTIQQQEPLSRAYYKLQEVYRDYIQPDWDRLFPFLSTLSRSDEQEQQQERQPIIAALDVGASPGGWTQVLLQYFRGIDHVVAIDKAQLGQRLFDPTINTVSTKDTTKSINNTVHSAITKSNRSHKNATTAVTHIQATMEEAYKTDHFQSLRYQYSVLVCDASQFWSELIDSLLENIIQKVTWCIPCLFVITMKLPCKTLGSIERQVQLIHKKVPSFIQAVLQYIIKQQGQQESTDESNGHETPKIHGRYQLVHLMANSDSERTLLVILEEEK